METTSQLDETRAFNAEVERMLAGTTSIHLLPPEVTRLARREGRGVFPAPVVLPQARDITIPTRGGSIPARVLTPESGTPTGIYLHIHGGGWTLGAHDMQDPLLWELVERTGMAAVSVGYRLAPEHPYPAGPDDCEDAALWLLRGGAGDLGAPDRHAIGGESAGAHLSAVTLLRLRDRHGITGAFAAANLVYGAFDLSLTPSQRRWGDRYLVLSTPVIRWFADQFLGDRDPEARRDPDVSPLYADLSAMPPALFQVGTMDPLLDDSLFMEARWRSAGGRTELRVYDEAPHGFTAFGIDVALAARHDQYEFLRTA
ncbi:MAG TPA: alpha/beta hydrolase [Candidatus Dormibacteraeota bacterium]|nr:alpha/beta hydrolase [Candidatus Dormibacteraeota bacterium]